MNKLKSKSSFTILNDWTSVYSKQTSGSITWSKKKKDAADTLGAQATFWFNSTTQKKTVAGPSKKLIVNTVPNSELFSIDVNTYVFLPNTEMTLKEMFSLCGCGGV